MEKDKFFKEINIWKPANERTVMRYRCFEILPDGKFFVQVSEHIYEDSDAKYRESLDDYFFGRILRRPTRSKSRARCWR